MRAPRSRASSRTAGFSLIELLVSMTIGLILTLAITVVMTRSESSKRSTTSVNDIDQTGNYVAYVLDRAIRSAGSGFSQNWNTAYGCLLNVSKGAVPVLPLQTALPAASAFNGVVGGVAGLPLRLAPVVIAKNAAGAGGDVLIVMAGAAGFGEIGMPVSPAPILPGATSLPMANTIGLGTDDLVLLTDPAVGGKCLVEQVGTRTRSASSTSLPLAGSYFTPAGATVALSAFGSGTTAIQLGNAGVNTLNMPQFQLLGVGGVNTLFSYDVLQPVTPGVVPDVALADGVAEIHALYGLDTTVPPDNRIDAWIDATAGSNPASDYSAATLTDGSPASSAKLRKIVAVRLGLVLRSSLAERPQDYAQPSGTRLTLFDDVVDASGTALRQTRTLSAGELSYRFRTVELTIPVRNTLLAP